MFWSMSFQLLPGEAIVDSSDSHAGKSSPGIKPAYSVFLTNKRVVFRFDSLRSSMVQSFQYAEILETGTRKRLFINYLSLKTKMKTHYLHVDPPQYWSGKIMDAKDEFTAGEAGPEKDGTDRREGEARDELLAMLKTLHENGVLTQAEFDEKAAALLKQSE